MHSIDSYVQSYISTIRTANMTESMYVLTKIFDAKPFILIVLCMAGLVYLFRGKMYSLLFIVANFGTAFVVTILKPLLNIPRPPYGVLDEIGQSFPSWHAAGSAVLCIMIMYIFDDYFSSGKRIILNTICTGLLFSVAFSRIYLGVHWVSDVVGGIFLASIISYVSILFFKRMKWL